MKLNTIEDEKPIVRNLTMIILGIIFSIIFYFTLPLPCDAQSKAESEWIEVKMIELPDTLEIKSGITSNGTPKYWFDIQGIKVYISPINKEHYINNTATIVIVEWYNKSKDRYKYTTRQLKPNKKVRINTNVLK